MIAISDLQKLYGQQTLFSDVSLQLNAGECYGVVGANGSGKSTFLKILAGDEPPSGGTVSIPKRATIGTLGQDHFRYDDQRILDVAMMGNTEVWEAMAEKERLLSGPEEEFDHEVYAELEETILRLDGYSLENRAGEILEGLGIPTDQHEEPMSVLSGGFRLRVLLAQVLAADPDVLLLDEPTNHLDILSIRWLETFLGDFPGCAVVVSHDHRFLDNVCTKILDIDYETILLYHGNYSRFEVAKEEERERKEREIQQQEKEIAAHRANIERFKAKASRARQAQSKKKLLERIEIERLPQSSRRYPTFRFQQRRHSGKVVVEAEGISKAYGDNQVLDDVSLRVARGDRLAVIGPNGIGKSTLLKILTGRVEADQGTVEWGYETHPGYFAQDHREILGNSRQTVESWLWDSCPLEPVGYVRGKLGLVLFSGQEAEKKVTDLSGGEAARLIFARLAIEEPNVLVLDEPTNHLDLEAIDALIEALREFDGTLIFVSHDRWFVSRLATRVLEISRDGIRDFRGSYEEYLDRCGDDHLDVAVALDRARKEKRESKRDSGSGKRRRDDSGLSKARRRELAAERDRVTEELETAEARIGEINELYCDPGFFDQADPGRIRDLEREQSELSARVEELMERWEELEGKLTAAEAS
ncbi:MAG: ABC-F family ATP-binding cassette domain-containing protein [Thermoanaerobaculia bacterium]|nr:ABC-F family ATP-binding cassette domain-containing protein [Thermoanaerobaculia bacterium]